MGQPVLALRPGEGGFASQTDCVLTEMDWGGRQEQSCIDVLPKALKDEAREEKGLVSSITLALGDLHSLAFPS